MDTSFSTPFFKFALLKDFTKKVVNKLYIDSTLSIQVCLFVFKSSTYQTNVMVFLQLSLFTIGGRTVGSHSYNVPQTIANTLIDETIYFGGLENITNALSRMLYGTKKVRKDALPVNILISASTMVPGSEIVSVLEKLIDTNCRMSELANYFFFLIFFYCF